MKMHDNLTHALEQILLFRSRWDHPFWVTFLIDPQKLEAKADALAEQFGTRLPAWRRQDRKQAGLPNATAICAPVLGSPGQRQVIILATAQVQFAPPDTPWARERWLNRPVEFGSYVMVYEPRPRGDSAWTWRLQQQIVDGLQRYLTSLVKAGKSDAIRTETQRWLQVYTFFGGVRRQIRRVLMSGRKLWQACHGRPWPGITPEDLPVKIGFRATRLMPDQKEPTNA